MSKGPLYFDDEIARCRHCELPIPESDELGIESGYCSEECHLAGIGDDDDEDEDEDL